MATPLPPPLPPTQRPSDPILAEWDAGAREMIRWFGSLGYVAVWALFVVFALLAVSNLAAGEGSIGFPMLFWTVLIGCWLQRLARRRRR